MQVNLEPHEIPRAIEEVIDDSYHKDIALKEIWLYDDEMDAFLLYHHLELDVNQVAHRGVEIKRILDGPGKK